MFLFVYLKYGELEQFLQIFWVRWLCKYVLIKNGLYILQKLYLVKVPTKELGNQNTQKSVHVVYGWPHNSTSIYIFRDGTTLSLLLLCWYIHAINACLPEMSWSNLQGFFIELTSYFLQWHAIKVCRCVTVLTNKIISLWNEIEHYKNRTRRHWGYWVCFRHA